MSVRPEFETLRGKPSVVRAWMLHGPAGKGYQLSAKNYQYKGDPPAEGRGYVVSSLVRTDNVDAAFPHGRHNRFVSAARIGERVLTVPVIKPAHTTETGVIRPVVSRGIFGRRRQVSLPTVDRVDHPAEHLSIGDFDGSGNDEPAFAVGYDLLGLADRVRGVLLDGARRPATLTVATVMSETEARELTLRLMAEPRDAREYGTFVLRSMQQINEDRVAAPDYPFLDGRVTYMQFATDVQQSETDGTVLPIG